MLETSQTKIWRQKTHTHTHTHIYIGQKRAISPRKAASGLSPHRGWSQTPLWGPLGPQGQLCQNRWWLLTSFRVKTGILPFFPSSVWPLIYLSYIPRTHRGVWPVVRTQTQNRHVCMNDWLAVSLWQILLFFSGCLNPTYMLLGDFADLAPPIMSVTGLLPFVRLLKIRT